MDKPVKAQHAFSRNAHTHLLNIEAGSNDHINRVPSQPVGGDIHAQGIGLLRGYFYMLNQAVNSFQSLWGWIQTQKWEAMQIYPPPFPC